MQDSKSKTKKSRVLVNIIGIPLLLFIIIAGNDFYKIPLFSMFIFVVMILSTYEWHNLVRLNNKLIKLSNYFFISIMCLLIHLGLSMLYFLILISIHLLINMMIEIVYSSQKPLSSISFSLLGFLWIGFFIGSMVLIRESSYGLVLTLTMFLSIWLCDTFAFVFGSSYGKTKLLPSISPNKTWLGAIFGFLASFIVPLMVYNFFPINDNFMFIDYIVFSFIFGIFGQFGDLGVSLLKRQAKIKDTSNILQGHGGILDRFDSLSFVSPVLFFFLYFRALL